MGPFDLRRHRLVGDRPQRRDGLHRGERQVVAGDRLCPWPGVLGDLRGQLPRIVRLAAVLGGEELAVPPRSAPGPDPPRASARPPGRPAAVLMAAIRLATSTRNGLTTSSTILNGAPSRVTSGSLGQ